MIYDIYCTSLLNMMFNCHRSSRKCAHFLIENSAERKQLKRHASFGQEESPVSTLN